jgi:phage antirepressor YoqD-like protein
MSNVISLNQADSMTMSSREIAELVDSRHDSVKRAIERLATSGVIVQPPVVDEQSTDAMGRSRTTQVYRFTGEQGKRDSIIVVAQLCPEFTARLVDRWQELERQLAAPRELSRIELIQMALQSEEERLQLEKEKCVLERIIEEDAPLVAFAKQVEVAPDAISVSQAAKILGTGQRRLFAFLRQIGWISRRNEPYQAKIEAGYLDVKLGSWNHPDHGLQQSVTALVTGKGLAKLQKLWSEGRQTVAA